MKIINRYELNQPAGKPPPACPDAAAAMARSIIVHAGGLILCGLKLGRCTTLNQNTRTSMAEASRGHDIEQQPLLSRHHNATSEIEPRLAEIKIISFGNEEEVTRRNEPSETAPLLPGGTPVLVTDVSCSGTAHADLRCPDGTMVQQGKINASGDSCICVVDGRSGMEGEKDGLSSAVSGSAAPLSDGRPTPQHRVSASSSVSDSPRICR